MSDTLKRTASAKGGSASVRQPTEAPDSLHSVAKARIMLALGEGEFAGPLTEQNIFLDGSPLANASGQRNFDGVSWDWRPGSVQQEPIPGINEVASETSVGVELKQTQPWQHRITNTQLDGFRIRIGFPRMVKILENGDSVGTVVNYRILLSVDDGPYQVYGDFAADGKTTSLYERGHLIMLPAASAHWDVRVERTTADSTSDTLQNSTNIEAYSDIIFAKFRYPNTAVLFIEFDSRTFGSSIPKITVRVKMRRVLIPRNYDPVTRTYTGTWDGQFKFDWTDNPAWIWLDIVTNKRFGAGEHITVDNVNKWELYRISQYCDQLVPDGRGGTEPRHTCNVYIQTQAAAFSVLRDIANIFNGMVGYQNSEIIARADMPDDVVKVVSNADVIDGSFEYSGGSVKDRYSVCMVQFSNPDNGYSDDTDAVRELDLVRRYGVNQLSLSAIGCTRRSEAQRRGRWALLSNSTDRTVKYATGLQGLSYHAGQVIAVSDAFTSGHRLGGRVVSSVASSVTLDAIPEDLGVGATLLVNTGGGVAESRTIIGINTETKTVSVDQAFDTLPQPEEVWTIDSASFNGGRTIALQYFRVMSITNNEDGTFAVEGLWYNPGKYAAIDAGTRIPEPHYSDIPGSTIAAPEYVKITSYTKLVQTMSVQTMRVEWPRVPGAVGYRAQWRRDNGEWINMPENASLGFEIDGIYAGTYQARVCAVSSTGATSLWAQADATELTGKDGDVPPPLAFLASRDKVFAIEYTWLFGPDTEDTQFTEIQYSTSNDLSTMNTLAYVPYPQNSYLQGGLANGVTFFARARLVDRLGNKSAWTALAMGQSSFNAEDIQDAINEAIRKTPEFEAINEKIDDNIEAIMRNSLNQNGTVTYQFRQLGETKAEIARIATTSADQFGAFAQLIDRVQVQVDDNKAAIQTKATAQFDNNGTGNATYSVNAGVTYKGVYYSAGMAIGVSTANGITKSSVLFNADTFAIYNGTADNAVPVFTAQNNQAVIRDVFIGNGTITNAKIGDYIQSNNWVNGVSGWRIDKAGWLQINTNSGLGGGTVYDGTGLHCYDPAGVERVTVGKLN